MIGLSDPVSLSVSRVRIDSFPDSNLMLSAGPTAGKHLREFRDRHGRAFPGRSAAVITNVQAPDKSSEDDISRTR